MNRRTLSLPIWAFNAAELGADAESQGIFENITRRNQTRGVNTIRNRNGDTVRCDYWAVRTNVARIPYVLLMLWQPNAVATATA